MKLFFLMEDPIIQRYQVCTRVETKGLLKSTYYKEEEVELRLEETVVRGTVVKLLRKQREIKLLSQSAIKGSMNLGVLDFLNELELIVSEEGKIVSIENDAYLYHCWEEFLKNKAMDTMEDFEDNRLKEMDNKMSESVFLLDFLERDLFLYFFFHIYGYYSYNPVIRNRRIPNFLGYSFFMQEQLEYITTAGGDIEIVIEGNLSNDGDYVKQSEDFFRSKGIAEKGLYVGLKGKYDILPNNIPFSIDIMLETEPYHELFYKSIHLSIKALK